MLRLLDDGMWEADARHRARGSRPRRSMPGWSRRMMRSIRWAAWSSCSPGKSPPRANASCIRRAGGWRPSRPTRAGCIRAPPARAGTAAERSPRQTDASFRPCRVCRARPRKDACHAHCAFAPYRQRCCLPLAGRAGATRHQRPYRPQSHARRSRQDHYPNGQCRQGRGLARRQDADPGRRASKVNEFAGGLDHPRWLLVLPNGDVLVAETDSPGTDKTGGRIQGKIQNMLMKKAGSGKPSANRISLLRDADGDGIAETKTALLTGLYSPFGMALVGNGELFVANADGIVAFPFQPGPDQRSPPGRATSPTLPSGYNHHWTKSLVASPDGKCLYVGVGSNSNVGENGMEMEKGRAAIWGIDARTGAYRIFASGLRNPVGIAWNPWSGALWTVVNERDELGNDLVPDYLTSVQRRRLLRLAVELLRPACRCPRQAAAARHGRQGDHARLCARSARRVARPDLLRGQTLGPRFARARSSASTAHGTASRRRLPGRLRPVRRRAAVGHAGHVLTGFRSATWPTAGRSECRSPGTAACSSPTTSAARCGGSARRFPGKRGFASLAEPTSAPCIS